MTVANFRTDPVSAADQTVGFDSGTPALDQYFARHAFSNDRRGIGRTFVLRNRERAADLPEVIGFYSLSMATVDATDLPRKLKGNVPKYPLPAALIGRLAVDQRCQGRGFGESLLTDALHRILLQRRWAASES